MTGAAERTGVGKDGAESWFPVAEAHPIRLSTRSKIVLDSAGLGWRDAYASVTSDRVWSGRVEPIPHTCLVYCMRRANTIERWVEGEAAAEHLVFRPRQFGFIPTHAAATYSVKGGADVLLIYLRAQMIVEVAGRMLGETATRIDAEPRMGFVDPFLEQVALGFITALNRQDPSRDAAYVDQLAIMAAAHVVRYHRRERPDDPLPRGAAATPALSAAIQRVCDYIEARLDGDLSLDALAREAGASPALFTQAFAQAHHLTPHQYVIRRRVAQAARMLIGTSLPLSEIALRAGFASQSHFSNSFKRITGETPNAYRRAGATREPERGRPVRAPNP